MSLPDPCVVIVSGVPGAGKTTVSRLLAERLELAAHIEADVLQRMILSGQVWPDGEPAEVAQSQLALRGRNVCLLARSFVESGVTAVIDDVVIGSRLTDFRRQLQGLPLFFVLLLPDAETVRRRNVERGSLDVHETWAHLDAVTRAETPRVGLWLGTSELSAEETVDLILASAEEALVGEEGGEA